MRTLLIRLCAAIAVLLTFGCSSKAEPFTTEMLPMRDGTKLATDIYLPKGDGPFPVVLIRTPYERSGAEGFVGQGYAVVIQSTRGRYKSEGISKIFVDDGWNTNQDGADCVTWVKAQKWCNGKIGTFGASANAITQLMMAGSRPAGLTAICAIMAPTSFYNQCVFQNGAKREEQVVNWLKMCQFNTDNMALWQAHPYYDGFWAKMNLAERFSTVNVPGLHIGGWYDTFQQGTLDAFEGLQKRGGPGARGQQRLIIGPFSHGGWEKIGDFTYPNGTKVNPIIASVEWLNDKLKGIKSAVPAPAVQYYTMGAIGEANAPGNEWRIADTWPVPAQQTTYYLQPGSQLSTSQPKANVKPASYKFDPKNPVPSLGGCNLTIASGPMDQRPSESRPDVLLFSTEKLSQPVEVTGRIKAKLWITSTAKDTDFTAKLTDVYPDGRSMLVCDGIIRARVRKSLTKPELLTPGKPTQVEVDLWSTSLIFNKGHRIRLAISSSNSPRFDVNPNTGELPWLAKKTVIATNSILLDAAHPSVLVLPIVK
ncbi:MAG: CocE/NonD family hydrolase [Armatimonadota bacterium]